MNKNTTIGIIIVLVILVGGYVIINNRGEDAMEAMPSPSTTVVATASPVVDASATVAPVTTGKTVTVDVAANNFNFAPSSISVNKGDTVKIVLHNNGGTHDFRIDEFSVVSKMLGSGGTDTFQFVADKAGSFEYYCSVGNHRAMGMKGTLIVK